MYCQTEILSNYSVILLEFVHDNSLQETTVEPSGHFYNKDSSLGPRETRIHIMSSSNISDDDKVWITLRVSRTKKFPLKNVLKSCLDFFWSFVHRSSGRSKVFWDLEYLGAVRRNGEGT